METDSTIPSTSVIIESTKKNIFLSSVSLNFNRIAVILSNFTGIVSYNHVIVKSFCDNFLKFRKILQPSVKRTALLTKRIKKNEEKVLNYTGSMV